jgi:hypothetical protein
MSVSATEVAAACEQLREKAKRDRELEWDGDAHDKDYLAAMLEAQQAEITRLREVLEWLNRRGGLGVKVHEHIEAALMQVIAAPAKADTNG